MTQEVRNLLLRTGFCVSDRHRSRGFSFDMVARRDRLLLLIKVLLNVDALSERSADELRAIGSSLEGTTLLVGAKSGSGDLTDGVVYSRFNVPIISLGTLGDYLAEGVPPFMFSAPGGLYVRTSSDLLRRAREERAVSLGRLAEIAHVSRRTIQMYMEGMNATIDAAVRLEEFLEEPFVLPIDPFHFTEFEGSTERFWVDLEDFEKEVFGMLTDLGYKVLPAQRSPFDALTRDDEVLFVTGLERRDRNLEEKASMVANISRIAERDPVIFVDKSVRRSYMGIPIIDRKELEKIRAREEMAELVEERKG